MSQRPGVMIWLDWHASIGMLSDEASGKLFKAILDYAEYGVVPDFSKDATLSVVWALIRPKIDHDAERYDGICTNKRYSTFCRDYKNATECAPPTRDEWASKYHGLSYKEYIEYEAQQRNSPTVQSEPDDSKGASTQTPENQCEFEDYAKQSDEDFEKLRESQLQLLNANRAKSNEIQFNRGD